MTNANTTPAAGRVRGFSLVEMLLAIFILGIGVISIAALFPAGIALQRQATDDVVGPIVAKNALSTIRSKLSQSDFGSFYDFGLVPSYNNGIAGTIKTSGNVIVPQVSGDWCWMRPGFLFDAANNGTIDVFSAGYTRQQLSIQPFPPTTLKATEIPDGVAFSGTSSLFGIPYNRARYPLFLDPAAAGTLDPVSQRLREPLVTFTQAERSWPQAGSSASNTPPQYYWDCMFRRNGGRVQVAVFVYRVTAPGGDPRPYTVQRSDPALVGTPPAGTTDISVNTPPIPMVYYAPNPGTANSWPNRTAVNPPVDDTIPNTGPGTPFGAGRTWDDWMAPAQIWIDNHGNQHEVLRGRLVAGSATSAFPNQGPVKLQRRIPVNPRAPIYGTAPNVANDTSAGSFHAFIEAIWFVPNTDRAGNVITPIYVTVEEL
jgi:prepilin-type N-terminal cleavage/methylation domain-containing protein